MDVLLFYPTLLIPTLYKPHTGVFLSRDRDRSFCVYSQRVNVIWQPENFESDLAVMFLRPEGGPAPCGRVQSKRSCALSGRGWWSCWIKQLLYYSSPCRPGFQCGGFQALILSVPMWIAVEFSEFTFRQELFYHCLKELTFQWCWKRTVVMWSLSSAMLCALHAISQIM